MNEILDDDIHHNQNSSDVGIGHKTAKTPFVGYNICIGMSK